MSRASWIALAVLAAQFGCKGSPSQPAPPAKHHLHVSVDGSGQVTSVPAGINCPSQCDADFQSGTKVTLNAAPQNGASFTGWSGGPCNGTTSAQCAFSAVADLSITATFAQGNSGQVAQIEVDPASTTLQPGQDFQFTATARDAQNNVVGNHPPFTWTSDAPSVATPHQQNDGWFHAEGPGTATIHAAIGNVKGTATITVIGNGGNAQLLVQKTGDGSGTVVSTSPDGRIDCGSQCAASFSNGQEVVLSATADSGSTFAGWGPPCSDPSAATCTVQVNGSVTVSATFNSSSSQEGTLDVQVLGSGSGQVTASSGSNTCTSGDCQWQFSGGTSVTLTAAAAQGSVFAGWGGNCNGTSPTCTVQVSSGGFVSASATFTAERTLTVTANAGGEVDSTPAGIAACTSSGGTCSATFADQQAVTLTATPATGYAFGGWTAGPCTGSNYATCNFSMTSDMTATASFAKLPVLSLVMAGDGSGEVTSSPAGIDCPSGSCSAAFSANQWISLSATASAGSQFAGFSGAGCSGSSCSFSITTDTTITATFVKTHTVTVTIAGAGTGVVGSAPQGISCSSGGNGTCTFAFPDSDTGSGSVVLSANHIDSPARSMFTGWSGDCTGTGACTLDMSSDHAVTATFAVAYQISVGVSGDGTVTSSPAGIDCTTTTSSYNQGTCQAVFPAGTNLSFTTTAGGTGLAFYQWSGGCSGADACAFPDLAADHSLTAQFRSFDFSIASNLYCPYGGDGGAFSLLQGETRSASVTLTLTAGATVPTALSISGLPSGVTGTFDPASLSPTGSSTLTLTAGSTVPAGNTSNVTITATGNGVTRTFGFGLNVRPTRGVPDIGAFAIEPGGATALVTDDDRLTRVELTKFTATKTVASCIGRTLNGVAVDPTDTFALVGTWGRSSEPNVLQKIDLASGTVTTVSTHPGSVQGVALASNGTLAYVTDCGATSCATTGRLVSVDLASGTITPITSSGQGIVNPGYGVQPEPDGHHILVGENGASPDTARLLRINLTTQGIAALASGLHNANGVSLESGDQSALIAVNGNGVDRIALATGTSTFIAPIPGSGCCAPTISDVAIESGGRTALISMAGRNGAGDAPLVRVAVDSQVATLAPGRQSSDSLFAPMGIALGPGGTTALVTDCGPTNCSTTGRLVSVDLAQGLVTAITPTSTGIPRTLGVALESGGTTALLVQGDIGAGGDLLRVTLADGGITTLASGIHRPNDFAIESGGATALVTIGDGPLDRFTLSGSPGPSQLLDFPGSGCCAPGIDGVAIEPDGSTALVAINGSGSIPDAQVAKVDLGNGSYSTLTRGIALANGVTMAPSGTAALVTDFNDGRLLSVETSTGVQTMLASDLDHPQGIAVDAAGTHALVPTGWTNTSNVLQQISLTPTIAPESIAVGLNDTQWGQGANGGGGDLAIESGGATALFLDCGPNPEPNGGNCANDGRLVRVDLTSGAITPIVSNLNVPHGLVIESGGTKALVSVCGPQGDLNNCATDGRLVEITLSSGAEAVGTTGLDTPGAIVEEAGGTYLVTDLTGGGRLLRVDPSDWSYAVIASGLSNPREVVIEAGGATALIAADGIERVDLAAKTVTKLVDWNIERFALEASGDTVVFVGTDPESVASFGRAYLDGGAVDLLAPSQFLTAQGIHLESGGTSAIVVELSNVTGAIWRVPVPAPT